jgi:uncharacterized membrane protein
MRKNLVLSLITGLMFVGMINILTLVLETSFFLDIIVPAAAIIVLVLGPIMVLNLYLLASKYHQTLRNYKKPLEIDAESIKSIFFVSCVLVVLMTLYIMLLPAIYTVSVSSVGFDMGIEGLMDQLVNNNLMIVLLGLWSAIMGWLAFTISWFSFPMIISNKVSGITAIIYSLNMSKKHWGLVMLWGAFVVLLISASLITPYYLGLVISIPFLAFATFDANRILSKEINSIKGDDTSTYAKKLASFTHTS